MSSLRRKMPRKGGLPRIPILIVMQIKIKKIIEVRKTVRL